ncbi:TraB/GumN family protein [Albimonas pacifica]|uniref:TraB family protein n=1 Tax=Albimonas pacifica TaxID=1114924 RepID=A0A1I3INI2_9RHOB|nr:TraB/GumN family protein [Albimonas pacifica]SFI49506.1 hypothetical protein SAMN05216258_107150 [Albimonas pacifica]
MLSRFAKRIVQALPAACLRVVDRAARLPSFRQVVGAPPGRKADPGGRLAAGPRAGRAWPRAAGLAAGLAAALAAAPAAAHCGGGRDLLDELAVSDPAAHAAIFAAAEAEPNAEGLFWTVSRDGAPTSWLMGSYHLPHPLIDPAPPGAVAALEQARVMLMEMSPAEMGDMARRVAADPRLVANLDRPPLDQVLPPEAFAAVAEAMQALGLPPERTAAMRPWILMISLATPPCVLAELAGGAGSMDAGLAARAAALGLEVKGMETWDSLLPILQEDEWSRASLDALVLAAREADAGRDMQTTSARLYAQERVWPIWTYGIWRAERTGRDVGADSLRARLFDERNRRFVDAALPELEAGGAFVLAGALHLGGEQGMVELLRREGFTVERAPLR